ncbi:hypothetical protein MKW92_014125 [Papaver armeniacum]|nr:hypothetical protein MKW92_014125 [Papaver armeniacum]
MAKTIILFSLKLVFFLTIFPLCANAATYNVLNFGAKPNNGTDSTKPFLQAWSLACRSVAPATMWIPRGTYLVNTIAFSGPCKSARVTVQIDGKIQAPPRNYWDIGNYGNWVLFQGIDGLTINGGILDARGSQLWDCKRSGANCPQGATSLTFNSIKNGIVSGILSVDSQRAHMAINGCNNMKVRKVILIAPDQSPNTDGIDIQSSTGVTIIDSSIRTGDDCIAIGPGTKNVLVQRVACGPGHGIRYVQIRTKQGVEGITVKDVTFTGSDNGLRIKTWRNQNSGVKISGVTYLNISGTSATPIAIRFHCSATTPCNGIKLHNVNLTYSKQPAKTFCFSALGTSSVGQLGASLSVVQLGTSLLSVGRPSLGSCF